MKWAASCSILLCMIMASLAAADQAPSTEKAAPPRQGPSWSKLSPWKIKDVECLEANANIGDKFPVQRVEGVTLFEVFVVNADKDHVMLEIRSAEPTQKVKVLIKTAVPVTVAGVQYDLIYPFRDVSVNPSEYPRAGSVILCVMHRPAGAKDQKE